MADGANTPTDAHVDGTVDAWIDAEQVLTPDGMLGPSRVVVGGDGTIRSVEPLPPGQPDGPRCHLLSPGFVDLQVNGIDDVDVAQADGSDWDHLDDLLLAQGTTAWCPTLVTGRLEAYHAPLARIGTAMSRPADRVRPHLIGVHLEGPFLGNAPGAHDPRLVIDLDLAWLEALPDLVRLVTLGAEQHDAVQAIALLTARKVMVSIGHSTATAAEFSAAVDAGAAMVTHLFNAMGGLHHRQPGLAACALTDDRVALGLIADGIHVHPTMIRLAFHVAPERVVLVTDAVGWRSGTAGSVRVELRDGAPRLPDGTLAGSALTMDAAVRTCVHDAGVPLPQALRAASSVPAALLGLADRGAIEPGRRADIVHLDADLHVNDVWVGGVHCLGSARGEARPVP